MKVLYTIYRDLRKRFNNCTSVSVEVFVAILLFGVGSLFFSLVQIIIQLLYFIIVLEITRMVIEYIKSKEHRVKIRYLIDAAIIAGIREIIIIVVDSHKIQEHVNQLVIYGLITFVLLIMRVIAIFGSPDEVKCNV
jgi:uncharacterized membrane protein (DUF373 family)